MTTKKKKKEWKEVKPGRIEMGDLAIVTLPKGSKYKYVLYEAGHVIDFYENLTDAKKEAKKKDKE